MAVPGQTPAFPTPPVPVIEVAPVLVRAVALSAPNDLASPSSTGSARFSMAGCSAVGAARDRVLKHVANSIRTASLLELIIFIVIFDVSSLEAWIAGV